MAVLQTNFEFFKDRDQFLINHCQEKSVLHVGAADFPYMKEKFDTGRLLHTKLDCARLMALDTSIEGCSFLNNQGFETCTNIDALISDYDTILIPEVIEHVGNYFEMLSIFTKKFPNSEFIITTPNPFSAKRTIEAYLNYERYHPDHLSYISYSNLNTAMTRLDFKIDRVIGTFLPREKLTKKIKFASWIASKRHALSDNLIYICSKQ